MTMRVIVRTMAASCAVALIILGLTLPAAASSRLQQTPIDRIEELRQEEPDYYDDFSWDDEIWDTTYDGETSRYFRNYDYHVAVDVEDIIAWGMSDIEASDFLLELNTRHAGGPLDNSFGVIFRYLDDDNFYYFAISSDGYYSLALLWDGEWETIIPWTESEAIEIGEESQNWVALLAEGEQITLLVNDTLLEQVEDDTFDGGLIGVAAGSFAELGVDIAFEDLALWDLAAPLPTPTPTATPRPRIGPRGTPTPAPVLSATELEIIDIQAAEPSFVDDFAEEDGAWNSESTDTVTYSYASDGLRIRVDQASTLGWSLTDLAPADFLVEVDATQVAGPNAAEWGLLFRYVDNRNYYFFAVQNNDRFSLWKRLDGEWINLVEWTEANALDTRRLSTNQLGVLARGDALALLANGVLLAEIEDDAFAAGRLGLVAGPYDEPGTTVAFDNLSLWDLSPQPTPTPLPVRRAPSQSAEAAVGQRLEEIWAEDPDLSDDFRRDTGAWNSAGDDDVSYSFAGQKFSIAIEPAGWTGWSIPDLTYSDLLFEADAEQLAGPDNASYGLIFRWVDSDNYYSFRVSQAGSYSLWRRLDGEWAALVEWTDSEAIDIEEGAINRLTVLAEGSNLALLVNDVLLAQVEDDSLAEGNIGLAVHNPSDASGSEVAFDNVDLWDLSESGQ